MLPYDEYISELRKFPTSFRVGVEICIENDGVSILLDKRSDEDEYYSGQWALFGSTILMRETIDDFWKRFEVHETGIVGNPGAPKWQFCGVIDTPCTERHHGIVQVFGRVWNQRPISTRGIWFKISEMGTIALVPSDRAEISMATEVLLHGKQAHYSEFLGTQ